MCSSDLPPVAETLPPPGPAVAEALPPPGPPVAEIAHRLPGRMRLRVPALRGAPARLAALAGSLRALPGVTAAAAGPLTGTLLLHHAGDFEALRATAEAQGLLRFADAPGPAAAEPAPRPDPAVMLPAAGALLWSALAVVQLLRREALPPAMTLGWQALGFARQALRRAEGGSDAAPEPEGAESG